MRSRRPTPWGETGLLGLRGRPGRADGTTSGGSAAPDSRTQLMHGPPRSSTARRLRARASRGALLAVLVLIGLAASPGMASAAATYTVKPVDRKSTRLNSSHANISYAV